MRKAITTLLAVLVLGGCNSKREQIAIASVFDQRQQAAKDHDAERRGLAPRLVKIQRQSFLDRIREINTGQCPKDFQEAWLNYVQAYEREYFSTAEERRAEWLRENATKSSGGLQAGATTGFHASSDNSNRKDAAKALSEIADSNEALRKCEQIALAHGVNALNHE